MRELKKPILSDDENFEFWQDENKGWYDDCLANPPEKEDILLLNHYYDEDIEDCAACFVEMNDFSEQEYYIPSEGIRDEVTSLIQWLERIARHIDTRYTPAPREKWDPKAILKINHENMPDGIHGTITIYDIEAQEMVLCAYVNTKEFIRSQYAELIDFVDYYCKSLQVQDFISKELDTYLQD